MSAATYAPKRADEIAQGDAVLVRGYDADGAYFEEEWIAGGVGGRRYGKGLRVTISWLAPNCPAPTVLAYPGAKTLPVRSA